MVSGVVNGFQYFNLFYLFYFHLFYFVLLFVNGVWCVSGVVNGLVVCVINAGVVNGVG